MTPYAVWSESRHEFRDITNSKCPDTIEIESEVELQDEFAGLMEGLIENLISSSAVELRTTFNLMQQSCDERRQREQSVYLSKELAKIEERTTAIVAEALVPVLTDLQRSRVLDEFASVLKKILPEFADDLITVNAPEALHGKISHALKLQSIDADIQNSEKAELVVAGRHVVLRADLDLWAQRLGEVATA